MALLTVQNLYSDLLLGNFDLNNINFTQNQFEKIAIVGETGCGKSTLLKTIAGLIQPQSGTIIFNGKKVLGPDWQLIPGEKNMAYLSQHYELRNNYRMEELLQYNNEMNDKEAKKLFEVCGISHLMKRNSYQLSGGEKQRIALARLLINKPTLLLLDEPFSNLDFAHRVILKNVLQDVSDTYKISTIITSHEPTDTLPWADKIIVLNKGKIIQEATPEKIFNNPTNQYVAALFGSYNLIEDKLANILKVKSGIYRPHIFQITSTQTNLIAVVQKTTFQGNYFEILVLINNEFEIVIHQNIKVEIGTEVYLSI
jgi:ABC-type glutathione transport system ATPase component